MAAARKWTINGDFVAIEPTGVARYAHEVTQALDALLSAQHPLAHDLELDLVVPRQPAALQLRSIATRVVPEFGKPRLPQFMRKRSTRMKLIGDRLSRSMESCCASPHRPWLR